VNPSSSTGSPASEIRASRIPAPPRGYCARRPMPVRSPTRDCAGNREYLLFWLAKPILGAGDVTISQAVCDFERQGETHELCRKRRL
jgi:hypothetical protein